MTCGKPHGKLLFCKFVCMLSDSSIYICEYIWGRAQMELLYREGNIPSRKHRFSNEKKSSVWGKMLPFRLLVSRGTRDFPETIQALVIVQSPTSA